MTDKLDWTAPLMLDDGKGTGVANTQTVYGFMRAQINGEWRVYCQDGTPVDGELPRIINRPRIAQPVEQLPADEPDTVTVPRMTEAGARKLWEGTDTGTFCGDFVECLRELGLIRPDTPLDRFTASHPNWRDLDKEDAVRLALEQRGEG